MKYEPPVAVIAEMWFREEGRNDQDFAPVKACIKETKLQKAEYSFLVNPKEARIAVDIVTF